LRGVGGWGDGGMGGWGDGGMGRQGRQGRVFLQVLSPVTLCPMPNAQCPMPNAQCPMPNAQCPVFYKMLVSKLKNLLSKYSIHPKG